MRQPRPTKALVALVCLLALAPAQAALFDPHQVKSGSLPNGLRVIVEESPNAPVVAVEVVVKVGVADEPPDQGGIAHLLEHVLWGAGGEEDPRAEIEELGGVTNAGTLRDFTHFYATVPAGNLELAIRSLARLVLQDTYDEDIVARERQVILEESAQRGDDLRAMLSDLAFATLYGESHPYGRRLEGTGASLLTLDAVRLGSFHRSWYLPNNMAVIVAGPVEYERAMEVVEAHFGQLKPNPVPSRAWPEAPRPAAPRGAVIGVAGRESYVCAAFLGPAISEPTEVCATDVLAMLLHHVTFGRLQRSLLGENPKAHAAGVDFLTQRDRGLVGVWAACVPSQVETVKQTIRQELTRLAEEPVSPKELMLAKRQALAAYAFANETVSDRATTLAFYEALGNYREAAQYVQRLRTLTAAEVQKVARWYAAEPVWVELAAREQTP